MRLHSACLTGDLLGSLRCDCGEQLRTAVARIGALGGGVLLYLDQEGRGIGLPNKLRAYVLQDGGLDTVDADHHLGFLADERSYDVAAALLTELGYKRIRLLTNNPQKINSLRDHGIEVVGRLPLVTTSNTHNERYLRAKHERAGHLDIAEKSNPCSARQIARVLHGTARWIYAGPRLPRAKLARVLHLLFDGRDRLVVRRDDAVHGDVDRRAQTVALDVVEIRAPTSSSPSRRS